MLPWVLYQSADPLRAVHGQAGIDAVIVETPYERVRYDAYLQVLQGARITPGFVTAEQAAAKRRIGFVIYAHSVTDDDSERGFLARFRARAALPGGRSLRPVAAVPFGPSDDFYDVGTFREERYVGSITFRFADICTPRGVLHVWDGAHRTYTFPYDLRRFR